MKWKCFCSSLSVFLAELWWNHTKKTHKIQYNYLIYVCFFTSKAVSTIIQSNYTQDMLILQADVKVECESNSLEVEGREQRVQGLRIQAEKGELWGEEPKIFFLYRPLSCWQLSRMSPNLVFFWQLLAFYDQIGLTFWGYFFTFLSFVTCLIFYPSQHL